MYLWYFLAQIVVLTPNGTYWTVPLLHWVSDMLCVSYIPFTLYSVQYNYNVFYHPLWQTLTESDQHLILYLQLHSLWPHSLHLSPGMQKLGAVTLNTRPVLACIHHLLIVPYFFFFFFFRHWTSFNGWKVWPSQRHLSISLDPGCRLSNFWPSFGKCPVWRYPPVCTWVFLVIFWLEDSI